MTEQVCPRCGTSNPEGAAFCRGCDTFVSWYPTERRTPAPAAQGVTSEEPGAPPVAQAAPIADPGAPGSGEQAEATAARAPAVALRQAEVVVTASAPGTFEVSIKNDSSIVDSYVIHAVTPPPWLALTHGDTNLLPQRARTVPVTLAVRPGALAVAHRAPVRFCARSSVDATRATEFTVDVVVPRSGPQAALVAHPHLVRLQDADQGSFGLRFDNRAANHHRRYRLSATDPEGVIEFTFVPRVVDVPAGGTAEAAVGFRAPAPPPGENVSRQVTVTATSDDGETTAQVTVVQATSPEPERVPVRLRLEPSRVTAVDGHAASLDVVVDNTRGHHPAEVTLRGRDPAHLVSFGFERPTVAVPPGVETRVRVLLAAAPPPRGQVVTHAFTVLASDGSSEAEAAGSFELTSRPAAISTARLRLLPDHLVVSSRRGTFTVELDNRYGVEPLQVHLTGADEFGTARLVFSPSDVTVPPGQLGRTSVVVEHPKPDGGTSSSRRVRVMATSGIDTIHGEAVFTQHVPDRRRLWATALVLLGGLVIGLGAIRYSRDPAFSGIESVVRSVAAEATAGSQPDEGSIRLVVAAALLLLLLLFVVMMLFGLLGRTGRAIRITSILCAACALDATFAVEVVGGLGLVLIGAVLAFVGGVLARPAA